MVVPDHSDGVAWRPSRKSLLHRIIRRGRSGARAEKAHRGLFDFGERRCVGSSQEAHSYRRADGPFDRREGTKAACVTQHGGFSPRHISSSRARAATTRRVSFMTDAAGDRT